MVSTTVELLKLNLATIEHIPNEEWIGSLEERKKKELQFHDERRENCSKLDGDTFEKLYSNKKWYRTTALSSAYVKEWIAKNAKEKIFLDYACGTGENALFAASKGATLAIGLDISKVSVEEAKHAAQNRKLTHNTYFIQADAENTKLPDSSVDVIICSGMLHHLDLSYALPELRRILAPEGRILAVEALDYNPIIKLYRYLTPNLRTEWEKSHILSLKDVRFAERFFRVENIRFWHISSILAVKFQKLLPFFNALDGILTKIPFVKMMSWMFTFELISRKPHRGK
jgi:SAM-dependent methyltransferase